MQRCRYMKQYMRIQLSNFSYRITSKRISCVAIYSVYHVGQILKAFIRLLSFASFNIIVCASHSTTSHLALVILRKGDPATRWDTRDPERSRRHQKENANTRGIHRSGRQHFRRVYTSPPKRRTLLRETDVNGVATGRSLHIVHVRDRTHHAGDKGPYPCGIFRAKHDCLFSIPC